MENPCLTFIISSILESDEFLVIDVIHEVAHSWFGNAVTNATWEEMWLSEGLATYAQRRITTETYGTARSGRGAGQAGTPGDPRTVPGAESSPAPRVQPPAMHVSSRVAVGQPHTAQGREPPGGSAAPDAQACPLPPPLPL